MTQRVDELFAALLQNAPVTTTVIREAKQEYDRLREVAVSGERRLTPAQMTKCPHCNKDIPHEKQNQVRSENEVTRLRQELQLKISMCQDLEEKIHRMQATQRGSNSSLGGDPALQVAEMYSRLFADQWLQAYEFMDNNLNQREDKVLDILQRILRAAYEFCKDISDAQMKNMEGEIYCPLSTWTEDRRLEFAVTPRSKTSSTISDLARQYRDMASSECVPILQETFLKEVLPEFLDLHYVAEPAVVQYTRRCVEVTWYMCMQSKPMYLVTKVIRKSTFDTNLFGYYTIAGDKFDFVVWPAVVQGENERIIAKGVAQAMDNNRSHSSMKTSIQSQRMEKTPPTQDNASARKGPVSPAGSLINQGLRGTPWGSQYLGSNRGTPSVDLPPTPTEDPPPSSSQGVKKTTPSRVSLIDKDPKEPAKSRQEKARTTPLNQDPQPSKSRRTSVDKQGGSTEGNPKSPQAVLDSTVPQSVRGPTHRDTRYSPPMETASLTTAWKESRAQPVSRPSKA